MPEKLQTFSNKYLDKLLIKEYNLVIEKAVILMELKVKELIEAAKGGDESAFEAIVSAYTPMLESVASSLSLDVDEVFSDACMALLSAVKAFDLSQDDVTFGLYAKICVRRRLSDYISCERRSELPISELIESVGDPSDVDEDLLREEDRRIFHESCQRLLSEYEYVVLQKWLLLDKTADIAADLHTSPKSIDNAKARIQKKLRRGLIRD